MTARETLIQNYAVHYRRVNGGAIPSLCPRMARSMQVMYGPLLASLPAGSKVLDIGCGTGVLLSWLAVQEGLIPVGVDSSLSQLEQARRQLPAIQVDCSDGLSYLRQHRDTFGAIYCLDVLEHLADIDLCLEWVISAREALRPGGFFLCRVPNGANLAASYSRYMDLTHERCFTSASILQLLEAGGLQSCRVVPYRAAHFTGRVRLRVETALHRLIFLICGHGGESIFTNNVYVVGYRDCSRSG